MKIFFKFISWEEAHINRYGVSSRYTVKWTMQSSKEYLSYGIFVSLSKKEGEIWNTCVCLFLQKETQKG